MRPSYRLPRPSASLLARAAALLVGPSLLALAASTDRCAAASPTATPPPPSAPAAVPRSGDSARRVVIRRTEYGVPHVRARDLRTMGFGLAWAMTEDYGERVPRELIEARGTLARHLGRGEERKTAVRARFRGPSGG